VAFTLIAVLTQGIRYWVIATLKERWTINVMILPKAPLVTGGPFRFFRHPNYLAVILEIIALPMIFNGYITAITFTILNAALLTVRIRIEERALGG
jgi:methyltransferase